MTIYLGSDHAGFKLKESMKDYLKKLKVSFEDMGNTSYDPNDDYPIFAERVARITVASKSKGILFCGSSQGVCIAANKVKGIRAVAVNNLIDAKLTREHNDANVLCLSGWNTPKSKAQKIIKIFLTTKFSNVARHKRRIDEIKKLEK